MDFRRRVPIVPTKRLYYSDPYLREFECQVLHSCPSSSADYPAPLYEVITDITAFYPNCGGQPADHGTLAGADVVDVIERDDEIIHLTVASVPIGPAVGRIDIERRFDHMQQHTGQHILSSAFASLFALETCGFHLGNETVTIDLPASDISHDQLAAAERLACEVIFQNRPIRAAFWNKEDIDQSRLRKLPTRTENIRLVDIDGFDLTPCGGTHCRFTGEVGLIKVIRTERVRGLTRVEFVCGRRALADYRWKNEVLQVSSAMLSVHGRELCEAIDRLQTQTRESRRQLEEVVEQLREYEAQKLYSSASEGPQGVRIVTEARDGEDVDGLKSIAHKVCSNPKAVALLGSAREGNAYLVFQRSSDVPLDVANLLKKTLPSVDGKGGGSPMIAQGGGKNPGALSEALELAEQVAAEALSQI